MTTSSGPSSPPQGAWRRSRRGTSPRNIWSPASRRPTSPAPPPACFLDRIFAAPSATTIRSRRRPRRTSGDSRPSSARSRSDPESCPRSPYRNPRRSAKIWDSCISNHAFQWEGYFRRQYEKHPERLPYMKDPDVFWLSRTMQAKELLFPKGRDPEEVLADGTDRLALKLMNNRDIQLLMVSQFGLVQKVMKETADPGGRIEELFLLMLSRLPTKAEKAKMIDHSRIAGKPEHAYIDGYAYIFCMLC